MKGKKRGAKVKLPNMEVLRDIARFKIWKMDRILLMDIALKHGLALPTIKTYERKYKKIIDDLILDLKD